MCNSTTLPSVIIYRQLVIFAILSIRPHGFAAIAPSITLRIATFTWLIVSMPVASSSGVRMASTLRLFVVVVAATAIAVSVVRLSTIITPGTAASTVTSGRVYG